MGQRLIDLRGQRFGLLSPVHFIPRQGIPNGGGWFCVCDCGGCKIVRGKHLRARAVITCGCSPANLRHGHSSRSETTRTYNSWKGMKQRCLYPKTRKFEHYGGRGITVCERWMKFENFLADMGERPEWADGGIDRIDSEGNYEPGNCRWADRHTQRINQRKRQEAVA